MRDEAAFVEFAEAVHAKLRRTAYLMCGDWHQASDHVQEGLIRVYVAWPRLTRAGREYAYARKCVVSAFLDHARRRSSTEVPAQPDHDIRSVDDVAENLASRVVLMAALDALAPRQRACVVLRYFEQLDVRETALALGCSEGTVKSQTSRALASLRAMFEDASRDELVVAGEKVLPW